MFADGAVSVITRTVTEGENRNIIYTQPQGIVRLSRGKNTFYCYDLGYLINNIHYNFTCELYCLVGGGVSST